MTNSYTSVTELPENNASKEQISRMYHRYRFAVPFCQKKDVLEVACGAGMGLSYLAKKANKVVGSDIDKDILKFPNDTYKDREDIALIQADAQSLPLDDNSFDVVLLYEAIYYIPEAEKFVTEAKRVLRENGVLIICTVNKEWSGFNPSPFTCKYYSGPELCDLTSQSFSKTELYGAYPVSTGSVLGKIVSFIKKVAVTFHLIPKTMRAKEFLKRIFFGNLIPIPSELEEGMAEYKEPELLSLDNVEVEYKILYSVAYL